jgi:hypothetical protein
MKKGFPMFLKSKAQHKTPHLLMFKFLMRTRPHSKYPSLDSLRTPISTL